ncbi:Mas-related G-protein coupled receptor member X3 [Plecturocebus cupreus]
MRRNAFSTYILNLAAADFLFLSVYVIHSLPEHSERHQHRALRVLLWPIWHRCRRPARLSAVVCVLLWALSLLRNILEWTVCGFRFSDADFVLCQTSDFITVAWLILLFVVLCGSSLALLVRVLCGSRKMPLTRLYVTILLTVLVFLLCGLPLGIEWALSIVIHLDFDVLFYHVHLVSIFLSSLNSSVNPIIYFFFFF